MNDILIRTMVLSDQKDVLSIYEEGINTGNATFETEAGNWQKWDHDHLSEPRMIIELKGKIVGWAALSPVSSRCSYRGMAEVSIYVSEDTRGKGIGFKLLNKLVEESERCNIWLLESGIFPENKASIKIHEKAGFRLVGIREKPWKVSGKWRDVMIMERRSQKVGIE